MKKTPVYYAGTEGSFSETAAKEFMRRRGIDLKTVALSPSVDPPKTLEAWIKNPTAYAVVPVWSDVLGPIPTARTKMTELGWLQPEPEDPDWMDTFIHLHSNKVQDRLSLPIHFDLLVAQGVQREAIIRIAAYSVALAQSRKGIERALKGQSVEFMGYPDSALAAKDLAALAKDPKAHIATPGALNPANTAVLALPGCASQFGLETAWAGVQDNPKGNSTHFVLLHQINL